MRQAAFIQEAGGDGMTWLKTDDRVESLVTTAIAEVVHERRAERARKEAGK